MAVGGRDAHDPVVDGEEALARFEDGDPHRPYALCLSGGGYRSMLFHLGPLIRLNELGLLGQLGRISSVSGGSITNAVLGHRWSQLTWVDGRASDLDELVVSSVYDLAGHTIDRSSILGAIVLPRTRAGKRAARAYDQLLGFDGASLQSFPGDDGGPRFIINATNVQTGKSFRFSKPYQGDWTVGLWRSPATRLADAVAASAAFPPILSPKLIEPSGGFDESTKGFNDDPVFRGRLTLTDGGIYDNLALEPVWRRFRNIFVSDGGACLRSEPEPHRDRARHAVRVGHIVDGGVRALRKRQIISALEGSRKAGAYWGVRSDVDSYELGDPLEYVLKGDTHPQDIPTRLSELPPATRDDLINWGYVIADTALRRWVTTEAERPTSLPR